MPQYQTVPFHLNNQKNHRFQKRLIPNQLMQNQSANQITPLNFHKIRAAVPTKETENILILLLNKRPYLYTDNKGGFFLINCFLHALLVFLALHSLLNKKQKME